MTTVRADIIDAYIVRRRGRSLEVLQLRRARAPMKGTWQPVMGHARRGESAVACMWREVREETGLARRSKDVIGAWALERVHPYFLRGTDTVILSPAFVIEVRRAWEPALNREHSGHRWVNARRPERFFVWSGQREHVRAAVRLLTDRRAPGRSGLALDP